MNILPIKALAGLVFLFLVTAALLFIPAGTPHYWQAWTILAVYFASSLAITLYLMKKDPKLLARHSMYAGALVMLFGIPIALGSRWGLLATVAMVPALIWRLFEEEKFLARDLPGYVAYQEKVRCHLIPRGW